VLWAQHLESCKRAQGTNAQPATRFGPSSVRRRSTARPYDGGRYRKRRELTTREAVQLAVVVGLLLLVSACGSCASNRTPPTARLPQTHTQAIALR
jgi:hypothetical protein